MKQKIYPTALTIAGSDSGGGAGIQADLKTFSALGVYGASVITAVTAQNTIGVQAIHPIPASIIEAQAKSVCSDLSIHSLKIGMLHSVDTIESVASIIRKYALKNIVIDPVMVATSGDSLMQTDAIDYFEKTLFPFVTILTPNIEEAFTLTGIKVTTLDEQHKAGELLLKKGCEAVLMKGGHLGDSCKTDILFQRNKTPITFSAPCVDTQNTHGTGCTLSSAIAAYLALGYTIEEAVRKAKSFITEALIAGSDIKIGHGHGPVNHFFNPQCLKSKLPNQCK